MLRLLQAPREFRFNRSLPAKVHARPPAAPVFRQLRTRQEDSRVPFVLFDIANNQSPFSLQRVHSGSSLRSQQSFSPNTIRSRLALHYKGLPYAQSWISYPDIQRLWEELSILPNDVQGKGAPSCTLPVLLLLNERFPQDSLDRLHGAHVPGIGKKAVDTKYGVFTPIVSTLSIAVALDVLFCDPDRHPPLFPNSQSFEHAQEIQSIITRLLPAARRLIIPSVPDILDDRGREYFVRTRKQWFNISSLNELRPQSAETEKLWQEIEDTLQPIIRALRDSPLQRGPVLNDPFTWEMYRNDRSLASDKHEADQRNAPAHASNVRYLSGTSSPIYADFILMAFLAWIARVDVHAWARLTQDVGGGVLESLWMGCLPYMKSDRYIQTLPWFR